MLHFFLFANVTINLRHILLHMAYDYESSPSTESCYHETVECLLEEILLGVHTTNKQRDDFT